MAEIKQPDAAERLERATSQAERAGQKIVADAQATHEASAEQSRADLADKEERERQGVSDTSGDHARTRPV